MSTNNALWLGTKWIIVPIAMAAVGFYVIGPRVGTVPALNAQAEKVKDAVQNAATRDPQPTNPDTQTVPDEDIDPIYKDLDIKVEEKGKRNSSRSSTPPKTQTASNTPQSHGW